MFGSAGGGALIDHFVRDGFESGVIFDLVEAFGNRSAARDHRRDQTVLLQRRPILWADEIDAIDASSAACWQRSSSAMFRPKTLLQTACFSLPFRYTGLVSWANNGSSQGRYEISTSHAYIVSAMGFALWIDTEARSLGAGHSRVPADGRGRDWNKRSIPAQGFPVPAATCPSRLDRAFVGLFGSLEEVNEYLESTGPRSKPSDAARRPYI